MPSEGLSVEQMCQAVQGMGVSPQLYRAADYRTAQNIICSATRSGMASILIIQRAGPPAQRHAVTVAGIKVAEPFSPAFSAGLAEQSGGLLGAYIHDDRWGPYVSTLLENQAGQAQLKFLKRGAIQEEEVWQLSHILIPMHVKIRLSFTGLQRAGIEVVKQVKWFFIQNLRLPAPNVVLGGSILRGYQYVEDLLFEEGGLGSNVVEDFSCAVSLPRYVGRIRVESPLIGTIDVLVDTTGTLRNLHCSAVICRKPTAQHAAAVGGFLAKHFGAFPRAFGVAG
jgi:hypothetical protein